MRMKPTDLSYNLGALPEKTDNSPGPFMNNHY